MRDDCFPQLNGDWDGPIRMLQEFVQAVQEGSHSEEPILMWNGATREVHGRAEFQSTVAFVLDGVPHHVDGEWLESARVSQLNAAACALGRLRKDFASSPPVWNMRWSGGRCRALVRVQLFGALHQFQGAPTDCEASAKADMALRIVTLGNCAPWRDVCYPPALVPHSVKKHKSHAIDCGRCQVLGWQQLARLLVGIPEWFACVRVN